MGFFGGTLMQVIDFQGSFPPNLIGLKTYKVWRKIHTPKMQTDCPIHEPVNIHLPPE